MKQYGVVFDFGLINISKLPKYTKKHFLRKTEYYQSSMELFHF